MRGALVLALLVAGTWAQIEEAEFARINPGTPNQIVIFYKSGEEKSDEMYTAVEEAAVLLGFQFPELKFLKCDASGDNGPAMEGAGLNDLPMLFVSIENQGMERYLEDVSATAIYDSISKKMEPITSEDVILFTNEAALFDNEKTPILVKFFEQWCSRCSAMKHAYKQVATEFLNRVRVMEVECSSTPETTAFCAKHGVDGFPTLKLFKSDGSVQPYTGFPNFVQMSKFLEEL